MLDLEFAQISDPGPVREGNEDCLGHFPPASPAEVRSQAARTAGPSPPEQRWAEIAAYRDYMVRHLDDAEQVESYEQSGVRVYRGAAKLAGAGRVEVGGETLETERIVIASPPGADGGARGAQSPQCRCRGEGDSPAVPATAMLSMHAQRLE